MRTVLFSLSAISLLAGVPAQAELPEGAQAMIDAAIATGDKAKVATVIELARNTWPEDRAEIDAIENDFRSTLAAREAAAAKKAQHAIRNAGLFERWSGEGELGAFQSSGNTESVGIAASLKLKRTGIDWTHLVRLRADYRRQNGATNREQYLAAYEPRWQFDDDIFAYGLAQYERDRIQGFSARYSLSGGLGYKIVDSKALQLSLKAGPAYRVTEFTDGTSSNSLAALAGFDFDWQLLDRLKLTQDLNALAETGGEATIILERANTSINLVTGLDFQVSDHLRSRLSYQVEYDSNPPPGKVSTDTHTRATLIYGF